MKTKPHKDVSLSDLIGAGMTEDKLKSFAEGARFLFGNPKDREILKPTKESKGTLSQIPASSSVKAGKRQNYQESPILAPKRKAS